MLEPASKYRGAALATIEGQPLELLRFIILGARGGENRGRILVLLAERPRNAYQLAKELRLNYGTVVAHLETLSGAGLIVRLTVSRYACGYAPTSEVRKLLPLVRLAPRQ